MTNHAPQIINTWVYMTNHELQITITWVYMTNHAPQLTNTWVYMTNHAPQMKNSKNIRTDNLTFMFIFIVLFNPLISVSEYSAFSIP